MAENCGGDQVPLVSNATSVCGADRALVLDFGSQYSRLIVRRLREIGVYSELRRCDVPLSACMLDPCAFSVVPLPRQEIKEFKPAAVILSGGPSSVYEDGSPHVAASFFHWAEQHKVAVLGICYGLQEMCYALGGEVQSGKKREFGSTWITVCKLDGKTAAADGAVDSATVVNGVLADGAPAEASADLASSSQRLQQQPSTAATHSGPAKEAGAAAGDRETAKVCSQEAGGLFDDCLLRESEQTEEGTQAKKKQKKGGDMLVWMSHGDKVTRLPPGFTVLASSDSCSFAAVGDFSRRFYGLQFHPEVTHTPQGALVLRNFVLRIAKLRPSWTMKNFLRASIEGIRERVGEEALVLGALSGGVDSTVAAALVSRAIGKRFQGVLIDTGLLRKDEAVNTLNALRSIFVDASVECVDARTTFLSALSGVRDPEEKRKIIGKLFVEEFEKYVKGKNIVAKSTFLLQGTLYPDVIESSSYKGPSHTIKTHHNVGGLPEKMHMKVLEPLRDLFKDEVRALGVELGLPHDRVYRHPFPGPGLAVRIVGEVTAERVAVLQRADAIFIEEIREAGLYNKIAQAFVVLLPDAPSVGVMGDCRTYEWTCVLRAVESADYMTADWSRLPYDVVARVSSRIINEVRGVNRVVMDVSSKPPATIEWE